MAFNWNTLSNQSYDPDNPTNQYNISGLANAFSGISDSLDTSKSKLADVFGQLDDQGKSALASFLQQNTVDPTYKAAQTADLDKRTSASLAPLLYATAGNEILHSPIDTSGLQNTLAASMANNLQNEQMRRQSAAQNFDATNNNLNTQASRAQALAGMDLNQANINAGFANNLGNLGASQFQGARTAGFEGQKIDLEKAKNDMLDSYYKHHENLLDAQAAAFKVKGKGKNGDDRDTPDNPIEDQTNALKQADYKLLTNPQIGDQLAEAQNLSVDIAQGKGDVTAKKQRLAQLGTQISAYLKNFQGSPNFDPTTFDSAIRSGDPVASAQASNYLLQQYGLAVNRAVRSQSPTFDQSRYGDPTGLTSGTPDLKEPERGFMGQVARDVLPNALSGYKPFQQSQPAANPYDPNVLSALRSAQSSKTPMDTFMGDLATNMNVKDDPVTIKTTFGKWLQHNNIPFSATAVKQFLSNYDFYKRQLDDDNISKFGVTNGEQ
jgi:hypothetical protein